jgi:predicted phosphodiesterase
VPQSDRYQICLQRYRAHAKGSEIIVNKLPNDAKVGVIGDWGTGNEDARLLLDNMMQREPNLAAILHLGDIYDTGSTQEVDTKFVAPMKAVLGDDRSRIPIFSISGDHEYFSPSDGVGFYGLIDTINAKLDKGWKQNASYFCLRTEDDKWQFLGADTGIESVNLRQNPWLLPEEIAWHQDRIQEFKGKGKTVFLTHHPLIVEMAGPGALNQNLLRSIGGFLQDLDLYLWGHDHWFLAYNNNLAISPGLTLPRGRLLGGSARETDAPRQPANPGWVQMAGGSPIVAGQVNRGVFNHTYAILDLGASKASYYQTPAWHPWDNKTANRTCPQAPLFVESL